MACGCSDDPDLRGGSGLGAEPPSERDLLEALAAAEDRGTPEPGGSAPPTLDDCASIGADLALAGAATYAVVIRAIDPATGGVIPVFLATAFAIDEHVLVTNGHVVEGLGDIMLQTEYVDMVGVQGGTGRVVRLDRAIAHPDYTGDAVRSPDVGLLMTGDSLGDRLELEPDDGKTRVVPGDEIFVVGFPGDVVDVIEIVPERTVPQVTNLSGSVSALRNFDSDVVVEADSVDVIQHTAPTSGGTSGSALLSCGRVVGVNNAGTSTQVINVGPDAEPSVGQVPAASNNFAIDGRHVHDLLALVARGERLDELDLNAHPPVAPPPASSDPAVAPPGAPGASDGEGTDWIAYSLVDDPSVDCDLVNGGDFEAVVQFPGRNLRMVRGADRVLTQVTVNTRNEIIEDGVLVGTVNYAPAADGIMLLWALALDGTVLALDPENGGLLPAAFNGAGGYCYACGYVDDPVAGRCETP